MSAWYKGIVHMGTGMVLMALLVSCAGASPPPTGTPAPTEAVTPTSLPTIAGTTTSKATATPVPPTATGQTSSSRVPAGSSSPPSAPSLLPPATGLPEVDRIVLTATPDQGSAPLIVRFRAEVTGHGFGCEAERWDFGEGTPVIYDTYCAVVINPTQTPGGPTATPRLPTPTPTVRTSHQPGMMHTYRQPGTYRAQYTLLGRGGRRPRMS